VDIGYYPGCALHGSSNDYGSSVRACLAAIGVGLRELDDWICCGATAAHSLNRLLAVALPARNLAIAERDMVKSRPNVIKTDEKCPLCLSPMVQRESRFGKYLSCSRFPKCKGKVPLDKEGNKQEYFVPIKTEKTCTKCNKNAMLLRKSARGFFFACSGFPKCRNIEKVTPEEVEKLTGGAGTTPK